MHNGFVNIDNEKMSKSLGNFFTIRDVLKKYDAETLRFFILRAHYRSPLNYSDVHLDDARSALRRLYTALDARGRRPTVDRSTGASRTPPRFQAAMDDDFNTPERRGRAVRAGRRGQPHAVGRAARRCCKALGGMLGCCSRRPRPSCRPAARWTKPPSSARSTRAPPPRRRRTSRGPTASAHELLAQGIVLQGLAARHHLGERPELVHRPTDDALVTPDYWDEACKHLSQATAS